MLLSRDHKLFKFVASRLFTILLIAVMALVGLGFYRNLLNQQDIDQEISDLQAEIGELEGQKLELTRLIDILESSSYIEKEARLRLGLKKPGEQVVSVPENARPTERVLGAAAELTPKRPNPLLWFDYFFLQSSVE